MAKKVTIGERIKEARKRADKTQMEIARTLKLSMQAVSQWERNATVPDARHLAALADALGVTVGELYGEAA